MFGLGGSELVVIALVALLVFGPSKLPEIARTIKRGLQEWNKVKSQVDDTISELKNEIDLKSQVEDELKPLFTPAKGVASRKPVAPQQAGLLPVDTVPPPTILDVAKHDDYLEPSADDLYPVEDATADAGGDYSGGDE